MEYTEFARPIETSGTIVSDKARASRSKTGGIIAELLVDEGEAVSKGPVARASQPHRDRRAGRTGPQRFEKAERDFKRVNNLYRDSAARSNSSRTRRPATRLAEQTPQIAGFNQRYSSIYATGSGRVLRKLMNEGELVGPANRCT